VSVCFALYCVMSLCILYSLYVHFNTYLVYKLYLKCRAVTPGFKEQARCISYMRQEDNIYNNRVYRDKFIKHQSIYYIAKDLLQNKIINIMRTKDCWRQCQLRNAT
jgi:hypothetical protein